MLSIALLPVRHTNHRGRKVTVANRLQPGADKICCLFGDGSDADSSIYAARAIAHPAGRLEPSRGQGIESEVVSEFA